MVALSTVRARVAVAVVFAAVAALVMLAATQHGVGILTDSVWYHDMAAGRRWTPHYAPGYPWLLRIASDRTIAVVSYAALVGGSALIAGPLAAALVLSAPGLAFVSSWAMSEAPFLAVLVGFLWAMGAGRYKTAAACAVALILLRHVGIAAVPVLGYVAWRDRRTWGLVYVLPAIVPLMALRSAREYAWHPPTAANWGGMAATIALALVPFAWPFVVAVVPAGVALVTRRVRVAVSRDAFTVAALAWCVTYTAVVVAARTVADADIPFNVRILSPVTLPLLLLLGRSVSSTTRWATAALTLFLAYRAGMTAHFVARVSREGQMYGAVAWRSSPLVEIVRALPADRIVYTNDGGGLRFVTGRATRDLPYVYHPGTLRASARDSIIGATADAIRESAATVIFARQIAPQTPYVFPESAFVRACGCRPDTTFSLGAVYGLHR